MRLTDEVLRKMVQFYRGDPRRIQHFIKVHSFAAYIGRQEGLDAGTQEILEIAALVHDIGIKSAEKKYGSAPGKLQELEGPPEARRLLEGTGMDPQAVDRVCFLVSRHHTCSDVDGPDHRILLEADFLVNCYEDQFSPEAARSVLQSVFRTRTGIGLLTEMLGL